MFTFASGPLTSRFIVEVDVSIGHVTAQVEVVLESRPKTRLALDASDNQYKSIRAKPFSCVNSYIYIYIYLR